MYLSNDPVYNNWVSTQLQASFGPDPRRKRHNNRRRHQAFFHTGLQFYFLKVFANKNHIVKSNTLSVI